MVDAADEGFVYEFPLEGLFKKSASDVRAVNSQRVLRELLKLEAAIRCGDYFPTSKQKARLRELMELTEAGKLAPMKSDILGMELGVPYAVWLAWGLELIGAYNRPKVLRDADRRRKRYRDKHGPKKATAADVASILDVSERTVKRCEIRSDLKDILTVARRTGDATAVKAAEAKVRQLYAKHKGAEQPAADMQSTGWPAFSYGVSMNSSIVLTSTKKGAKQSGEHPRRRIEKTLREFPQYRPAFARLARAIIDTLRPPTRSYTSGLISYPPSGDRERSKNISSDFSSV